MSFTVAPSGSLNLATDSSGFVQSSGYTMPFSSTATFNYTNTVTYDSGFFQTVPKPGQQYNVVVTGQGNAFASATTTATTS